MSKLNDYIAFPIYRDFLALPVASSFYKVSLIDLLVDLFCGISSLIGLFNAKVSFFIWFQ